MSSLLDDPWVAAQIDEVVAEYEHLWTKDQARAFREAMAWTLATHPRASVLLERERASTVRSGTQLKAEVRAEDKAAAGGKPR